MLLFCTIMHVELHGIVHTLLPSSEAAYKRAEMNSKSRLGGRWAQFAIARGAAAAPVALAVASSAAPYRTHSRDATYYSHIIRSTHNRDHMIL